MRPVRILTLLALISATMAVAAPQALGQTLEVSDELNPIGHCPDVTVEGHEPSGGCRLHLQSQAPVVLRQHVFGVESTISTCDVEAVAHVNENAEMYLTDQVLSGTGCTRDPCDEADHENIVWHGSGQEGPAEGGRTEFVRLTFCVRSKAAEEGTAGTSCQIDVPFREMGTGSHAYEFGIANHELSGIGPAGFRCEMIGSLLTENEFEQALTPPYDDVEIEHVDD